MFTADDAGQCHVEHMADVGDADRRKASDIVSHHFLSTPLSQ